MFSYGILVSDAQNYRDKDKRLHFTSNTVNSVKQVLVYMEIQEQRGEIVTKSVHNVTLSIQQNNTYQFLNKIY